MIPRVAFVNGGILGLLSYATWVRREFSDDREIHAEFFVLTENLSLAERLVRRALCQRVAPERPGWRNADLLRYRAELNIGLQARRRLIARGDEGRVTFLFVGGDFPRKGGPDLLDAWASGNLAARGDLVVVTDWEIPGSLPAGVRVVRGVRGETPEWTDLWRSADVFVMPTRNEAFGLVYQEASAASLPVIGTRLNAIPELIDDGITGLLVAPGNRDQLIAAMQNLGASSERRYRMGVAGRRKVESQASPDEHRRKLVALITQAAQHHVERADRH